MEATSLNSFLCTSPPHEIALRLRQLLQTRSEEQLSTQLLSAVEQGQVPASISNIWLSVASSPQSLKDALFQCHSVRFRRAGIKQLGKRLRSREWRETWDDLGGIEGFLTLFAKSSVNEVHRLADAIKQCHKGGKDEVKAHMITELLTSLLSSLYSDAPYKNSDDRLLQHQYARIAPACTQSFIRAFLFDATNPLREYLCGDDLTFGSEHGLLQKLALDAILTNESHNINTGPILLALTQRVPSTSSAVPGFSATMLFSLNVLRRLTSQVHANISARIVLDEVAEPLLRRARRRRLDWVHIKEIMDLAITIVQRRIVTGTVDSLGARKNGFLYHVVKCWSRKPDIFEDTLSSVMTVLPHSGQGRMDLFRAFSQEIQPAQLWSFLNLLFLHDQHIHADIGTLDGLRKIKTIRWSCDLFIALQKDQALSLLRNLISIQPDEKFLDAKAGLSILAHAPNLNSSGGDPSLLLTFLEQGDTAALERAHKLIAEKRRKATNSREQEDRAFFARAALLYAIASGSLPVYSETVIWTRRFVRDPLTCKTLYTTTTTNTEEGVAMLSGIPSDLSRLNSTDVRLRVLEGNAIILSFEEIHSAASREPHFRNQDWRGYLELLNNVLSARHERAAILQRTLRLSDDELFENLWLDTLNMLITLKDRESILERVLTRIVVPPRKLALLATTALGHLSFPSIDENTTATLERKSFHLLRLLASSDSPQLASDLILQAILERPESSSWHRILLSKGLVKRLPAADTQTLLKAFATSIKLKLDAQAQHPVSLKVSKPLIKVTTVKYLAQILDDPELVPPSFAIEVLCSLLRSGAHLDIRIAVVESLLAMLLRLTAESSKPLASRLMSALEETIPISGGLNERRPLSETNWIEAERTATPPEVYDSGGMNAIPPLLRLLVQWNPDSRWSVQVVQRIILPIIEYATTTNNRWIQIFLGRHGFILKEHPSIPVKPVLIPRVLLNHFRIMPASILDSWQQFVLININPSADMVSITDKVKADVSLRGSNEGLHWLSLFDQGPTAYMSGGLDLVSHLRKDWGRPEIENGITVGQVQNVLLEQAVALLCLSDDTMQLWDQFLRVLEPPIISKVPDDEKKAWVVNVRPVLERIIAHIESIRTPEWQQDPHRSPAVLPPTFVLRLSLLTYPSLPYPSTDKTQKSKTFAKELAAIVTQLADRASRYTEDFKHLSIAASKCPSEYKLAIAYQLWCTQITAAPLGLAESLRVELIEGLLQQTINGRPQGEDARMLNEILSSWRESKSEEVRMRGLIATRLLKKHALGGSLH